LSYGDPIITYSYRAVGEALRPLTLLGNLTFEGALRKRRGSKRTNGYGSPYSESFFYCLVSNHPDSNMTRRIVMENLTYAEFLKKVMGTSLLLPISDEAEKTEESTDQEGDTSNE
tara:strand:+ start:557 stop:901 length:345 start_codon:yes stop_codon:yes gene_type:complete